jgi:hypothetical protein
MYPHGIFGVPREGKARGRPSEDYNVWANGYNTVLASCGGTGFLPPTHALCHCVPPRPLLLRNPQLVSGQRFLGPFWSCERGAGPASPNGDRCGFIQRAVKERAVSADERRIATRPGDPSHLLAVAGQGAPFAAPKVAAKAKAPSAAKASVAAKARAAAKASAAAAKAPALAKAPAAAARRGASSSAVAGRGRSLVRVPAQVRSRRRPPGSAAVATGWARSAESGTTAAAGQSRAEEAEKMRRARLAKFDTSAVAAGGYGSGNAAAGVKRSSTSRLGATDDEDLRDLFSSEEDEEEEQPLPGQVIAGARERFRLQMESMMARNDGAGMRSVLLARERMIAAAEASEYPEDYDEEEKELRHALALSAAQKPPMNKQDEDDQLRQAIAESAALEAKMVDEGQGPWEDDEEGILEACRRRFLFPLQGRGSGGGGGGGGGAAASSSSHIPQKRRRRPTPEESSHSSESPRPGCAAGHQVAPPSPMLVDSQSQQVSYVPDSQEEVQPSGSGV